MHICGSKHYIFCIQPLYPVNDGFPLMIVREKFDMVTLNNLYKLTDPNLKEFERNENIKFCE